MIRKGQACWIAASAKVGLLHRFILGISRGGELNCRSSTSTFGSTTKLQHIHKKRLMVSI